MDDYWSENTGDSSGADFWATNTDDSSGGDFWATNTEDSSSGDFWDVNTYIPDPSSVGLSSSDVKSISDIVNRAGSGILNFFKKGGTGADKDDIDWRKLAGAAGGLYGLMQSNSRPERLGYQGGIPKTTAVRERVPIPEDPNRRPGAGGRRYFSDVTYAPAGTDEAGLAALQAAKTAAQEQAKSLVQPLYPAPQSLPAIQNSNAEGSPLATNTQTPVTNAASNVINLLPVPKYDASGNVIKAAGGGLMGLAKGRYLNGESDGMADKIPARIDDQQEARLSHGEFVVPADVVSHLGNGNSEAGAKRLYEMMDRIRTARTGTKKQGKQINPNKFMPG